MARHWVADWGWRSLSLLDRSDKGAAWPALEVWLGLLPGAGGTQTVAWAAFALISGAIWSLPWVNAQTVTSKPPAPDQSQTAGEGDLCSGR
jgi:hypothetical protein